MPAAQRDSSAYEERYQRFIKEEHLHVKKPVIKHKKQSLNGNQKLKALIGITLVFGVAFCILFRYVSINELKLDIEKKKVELHQLQMANQQTQVALESSVDLKKIEDIAVNKLGMKRPEKYQTVYVNLKKDNYSEVVHITPGNHETGHPGALALMVRKISNVLEYLN